MTELEPLLQTSTDETELALLRALDAEEPSAAALATTAAALGLAGGALATASSASAAGAAGGFVKTSIWGPVWKALAIGATSGLVVSAAAPGVFSEAEPEPTLERPAVQAPAVMARPPQRGTSTRAPSVTEPAAVAALPEEPVVRLPLAPRSAAPVPAFVARSAEAPARAVSSPEPEPRSAAPTARATFAPVTPPTPVPAAAPVTAVPGGAASEGAAPAASAARASAKPLPAISIAEEVETMDRARKALSSGRARDALNELERYQARWPRGTFASEVLVLRVEAKLRIGDRAGAVREARALIDARPNSRYAARLRALIENSK